MIYQLILVLLPSSLVFGKVAHVRWEKVNPYFTNDIKDFVVFNNTYGEPVYVNLKLKVNPEPLKISMGDFIKFYLYTKKNPSSYQQLYLDDKNSLQGSNLDVSKKTLVVIHGYMNNINSESIQAIKDNVLANEDVNVIGVDWSLLSDHLFYHIIAAEVPLVGSYIGDFVNFLSDNGVKAENFHIIGHSLGAQAAGFVGKTFKNGKLARISGLDPALPGFEGATKDKRLDAQDAVFVDCIHTCGGSLGIMEAICQADFYPNGGTNIQPGCSWIDFGTCSHGRSHEYFAESIQAGHIFHALTCPSIPSSAPVDCKDGGALMGYPATNTFLGIFYVTTNSASPFAQN